MQARTLKNAPQSASWSWKKRRKRVMGRLRNAKVMLANILAQLKERSWCAAVWRRGMAGESARRWTRSLWDWERWER